MFKWNSVKANNHPNHENPVMLSVITGEDGVVKKAVTTGSYDTDYSRWEFNDDMYDDAIVVAWGECPEPFDED